MPFKIRTKLLIAFFALIVSFIVIGGILVLFSADKIHKSVHKIRSIAEERAVIANLIFIMDRALMPGNDYIITGDRKYIDDFNKVANEFEEGMKEAERVVSDEEARKMLRDTRIVFQNIKNFSQNIFEIKEPLGDKEVARLMEEMDYIWAYPYRERLRSKWKTYMEEYRKAADAADRVWIHSWIIMIAGTFFVTAVGIFFSFFYSSRFVKPIEAIHNGANAIAAGNFKTRFDVKTGDEIQQLSNAMNEMAAQLDSFTSNLQGMVEERASELRESEERFRQLFNDSNDAIFVHGITPDWKPTNFIEVNEAACTRLGYTREELLKMSPVNIDDPYMTEQRTKIVEDLSTRKRVMFEIVHVAKDGRKIPVEINARLFDLNKQTFVLSVARDITERKNAEEALKASEERFRTITNTAGDAIIGLAAPGNIKLWNKKAEEMFGYPADDVMGRDMHDLIVPDKYREKAREGLKGFFQTGAGPVVGKTVELTALRKDGMEFPIALSISAMKIQEEWQATGIIRDITERKKAEQELAKHVDELERYLKATVQREFRIKELRDRVEELEKRSKG